MVTSFKRSYACTSALSGPNPAVSICQHMPPPETPGDSQKRRYLSPGVSQKSLCQSLIRSLLLSPGSWWAQGFVCALQENVYPVRCKFCSQILLASKVKFPGVLSSFARSPGWEICLCPRAFLTVQEIIWYNFSVVCGPSAWWLYGQVNGDLLQEGLCNTLCDPALLHPEPLPLQQTTAGLCLCRRHSNTQSQCCQT